MLLNYGISLILATENQSQLYPTLGKIKEIDGKHKITSTRFFIKRFYVCQVNDPPSS